MSKRIGWIIAGSLAVAQAFVHPPSRVLSSNLVTTTNSLPTPITTQQNAAPTELSSPSTATTPLPQRFNLSTALLCSGLAFDSYTEPPLNSSRWERGSNGMNVAFQSPAFTRNLYKGLVEVLPIRAWDLPDEESQTEKMLSGGGVDASVLVAVVEGQWKEDVQMLEKDAYHEGVVGLKGAAHVGRSRTAWSNTPEYKSKQIQKASGKMVPYHIKSEWGKGGQGIFTEDEPPFYLYVQDPATARLAFTILDDNVVGNGNPIGSAWRRLSSLIPLASKSGKDLIDELKEGVLREAMNQDGSVNITESLLNYPMLQLDSKGWNGTIKLTSKPRKKDKNSQITMGAAAGAMVAGPMGAAVGGFLGSMYEGEVRGRIDLRLRYLPFPPVPLNRPIYRVKGGTPGIDWGELYKRFTARQLRSSGTTNEEEIEAAVSNTRIYGDMELCFHINHDDTGGSCCVYRSLEERIIAISFRGTCKPVDLFTDASIAQDPWVEGEDVEKEGVAKVHSGFRRSMNSISRRLKELVLAAVAPGESMSDYDVLVTGHSLGAALATLFVADIAESGIDAGRALPQTDPSDAWWKSIASTVMGKTAMEELSRAPPRPKSLRMYNFGSPRVGNDEFVAKFESLQRAGYIDEAYRIVNGEDIVARNPRSVNALVFGSINYDHCAPTVLVSIENEGEDENGEPIVNPRIWVEGESDDESCPVRDRKNALTSPLADGSLLGDLYASTQETLANSGEKGTGAQLSDLSSSIQQFASKVTNRLQAASATDIASIIGVDKKFSQREMKMIQSIAKGEALAHHMEDEYYVALGRACGFLARVGELEELPGEPETRQNNTEIVV